MNRQFCMVYRRTKTRGYFNWVQRSRSDVRNNLSWDYMLSQVKWMLTP